METASGRGEPFDIALLDLHTAEMEGTHLVDAIRERGVMQSTQLLVLSPLGHRAAYNSLKRAGVAGSIVKPVRQEYLFSMIARLCGRSTATQTSGADGRSALPIPRTENPLSVLVAEDNPVNQRVLTRMLDRLGHRYRVVADGQAAIEAVKESAYDLVLMDCQMPRVDGFEATMEIRTLAGPAGHLPIIAVTANAMIGDRERCLAAGMTGYITKPVRLGELAEALESTRRQMASVG